MGAARGQNCIHFGGDGRPQLLVDIPGAGSAAARAGDHLGLRVHLCGKLFTRPRQVLWDHHEEPIRDKAFDLVVCEEAIARAVRSRQGCHAAASDLLLERAQPAAVIPWRRQRRRRCSPSLPLHRLHRCASGAAPGRARLLIGPRALLGRSYGYVVL